MSYTWIKLYIEVLSDAKIARLPDYLWRRAVELFLLAGKEGNDGALPPVSVMGWELRLDETKLTEHLMALSAVGVVHEAEPGKWVVTNFAKRQASMTEAERQRRYRAGKAKPQQNPHQPDTGDLSHEASQLSHEFVTEEEEEEEVDITKKSSKSPSPPPVDNKKVIEDANRMVDGILENEKRAKGKKYTLLPEIYIPYGRAFSDATGLQPSKNDMAEWINVFNDWMLAGYQCPDISRAVREIVADGEMPITRPASITWKLKDISVKKRYEQPLTPPTAPKDDSKYVLPPRRAI